MSDSDEWKGTKAQKEALRAKFSGRCGYCGEPMKRMHADHIKPVIRVTQDGYGRRLPSEQQYMVKPERNTVGNMMPACASCNISKGGYSLEAWRELIARSHEIVAKEKSIFRAGVRFGVIQITNEPVVFYFERQPHEEAKEARG